MDIDKTRTYIKIGYFDSESTLPISGLDTVLLHEESVKTILYTNNWFKFRWYKHILRNRNLSILELISVKPYQIRIVRPIGKSRELEISETAPGTYVLKEELFTSGSIKKV